MARKPKATNRGDETKPSIPLEEDVSDDAENEGDQNEDAPRDPSQEETTEIKKVAPQPVAVLNERQFPILSFARGKGALGHAFMSEHNIKNKGRTVKRTRAEWDKLYAEFLRTPRG